MSVIFFSFMTGSSIVNIPGPLIGYAKNGAWISLLLSLSAGILFLSCILYLYRKFPDLTFIEYSRTLVGNWVTILLAIPFISFQFHMTSGIVLDIGLFMTSSMMRQTPLYLFVLSVFIVIALTVRSGIETIARMIFVPMVASSVSSFSFLYCLPTIMSSIICLPSCRTASNRCFLALISHMGFPMSSLC